MKHKSARRRQRIKKQSPSQKQARNENFFEARVQRKCEKCEEEEKNGVQKKTDGPSDHSTKSFFGHFMNNIDTKGHAMSSQNRTFFEGKMNDNFGEVKLHTDRDASNAARDIGAKAFTWKNHIILNSAHYEDGTAESKQLLAHELKHVQQQRNMGYGVQMMPEEESTSPKQEEGAGYNSSEEAVNLEIEAEL